MPEVTPSLVITTTEQIAVVTSETTTSQIAEITFVSEPIIQVPINGSGGSFPTNPNPDLLPNTINLGDNNALPNEIRKRAADTEAQTYGTMDFQTINTLIIIATAIGLFMTLASAMIFYRYKGERVFRASGRTFMYM